MQARVRRGVITGTERRVAAYFRAWHALLVFGFVVVSSARNEFILFQ